MSEIQHQPERHGPNDGKPDLSNEILPCFDTRSYRGERLTNGSCAVAVELSTYHRGHPEPLTTTFHSLPLCLNIRNHSPTGFGWGYDGSGPAQLALALLIDAVGDVHLALSHYQEFKRSVVSSWKDSWTITAEAIRRFVQSQQGMEPDSISE